MNSEDKSEPAKSLTRIVTRRKAARQSIEGNLQDQLQRLETEARVRQQL